MASVSLARHGRVWVALSVFVWALCATTGNPVWADENDGEARAPAASSEREQIERWIEELGADDFAVRERATEALSKAGKQALPLLEEAAKSSDAEVRWRARKALEALKKRLGADVPARPKREPKVKRPEPVDPFGDLDEPFGQLPEDFEELLRGSGLDKVLGEELGRAMKELERMLGEPRNRPQVPRQADFWRFRFKDGKWVIERMGAGAALGDEVGLETEGLTPLVRAQLEIPVGQGLAVKAVRAGSIAARAGLARHDIVLRVDGEPIAVASDLLRLEQPGEHEILVLRTGDRKRLTVKVGGGSEPKGGEGKGEKAPKPRDEGGERF